MDGFRLQKGAALHSHRTESQPPNHPIYVDTVVGGIMLRAPGLVPVIATQRPTIKHRLSSKPWGLAADQK